MKKEKVVKEFHFIGLSKQELSNILNKELPINIKSLEPIVNRVYEKYPVIDKSEVSLIIKTVFEAIREFLVLGYVINFNKLVFDMKLHFFQHVIGDKFNTALKVKLKASPKFKKGLNE